MMKYFFFMHLHFLYKNSLRFCHKMSAYSTPRLANIDAGKPIFHTHAISFYCGNLNILISITSVGTTF